MNTNIPLPAAAKPVTSNNLARWVTLLSITVVIAAGIAWSSNSFTYDERLVDLAARKSLSGDAYRAASGSLTAQALLLDVADDRDLTYKIQLVLDKYGPQGVRVLDTYGSEEMLQRELRTYGENIVPVVSYFMDNDIVSLRLKSKVGSLLGREKELEEGEAQFAKYGPEMRGLHAIEKINADGHQFLGQFSIDDRGTVHWNQTARTMQALEDFFAGGVRDLETKHDIGAPIGVRDVALAGADVLAVVGAVKALKLLRAARVAKGPGAATRVGVVESTAVLGRRVLQDHAIGRSVIKLGVKAAAVYLVVRHPSLLSSLFVEAGELLHLPPRLATLIGWLIVLLPIAYILAPLLGVLGFLVPVIGSLVKFGRWIRPRRATCA